MRWLVVVLVGCTPEEPATCDGGGEPMLEVGTGDSDGFIALDDGAVLEGSGSVIELSFVTTGLNTTAPITTVVRIAADGGTTQDSVAQLTYNCSDEVGTGWAGATAALPAEAVAGSTLNISVSTTDGERTNATRVLTGTLAP